MKLIVVAAEYYHTVLAEYQKLSEALVWRYAVHMHPGDSATDVKVAASLQIAQRADIVVVFGGFIGPNVRQVVNQLRHWANRIVMADTAEDLLRMGREERWDEWPALEPVTDLAAAVEIASPVAHVDDGDTSPESIPF